MTALTDLSDIINRLTGGSSGTPEHIFFYKDARVGAAAAAATVAGRWTSLWEYNGNPSHGAVPPTSAANPDNTTQGGLKQADPGGGREKWLLGMSATGLVAGVLVLYDRLLHISGLSGTNTSPQTVGGSLSRYTDGLGNFVFAEVYTQIGASSALITMSYTDQSDGASTSPATAIGNTGYREAQRAIILPLAAGDYGVKAVASVDLDVTTGTAGNFGVVIGHALATIPIPGAGIGSLRDFLAGLPQMVEIQTDACLALLWLANTTTVPQIFGSAHMIEA
jgi:hypothetical protein